MRGPQRNGFPRAGDRYWHQQIAEDARVVAELPSVAYQ